MSAYIPRAIVHLRSFAESSMDIQLKVQWSVKAVGLHLRALHQHRDLQYGNWVCGTRFPVITSEAEHGTKVYRETDKGSRYASHGRNYSPIH